MHFHLPPVVRPRKMGTRDTCTPICGLVVLLCKMDLPILALVWVSRYASGTLFFSYAVILSVLLPKMDLPILALVWVSPYDLVRFYSLSLRSRLHVVFTCYLLCGHAKKGGMHLWCNPTRISNTAWPYNMSHICCFARWTCLSWRSFGSRPMTWYAFVHLRCYPLSFASA